MRRAWIPATGSAAGLSAAVFLVLQTRRPDVLSSGSIQFALSILSILIFLLLLHSTLRRDTAGTGFAFNSLDFFFAASVALALVSFLVASKARENFLQPYMAVTAFALNILVRINRHHLKGRTAARIAKIAFLKYAGYGLIALLLAAVGLSRCRTSYAALLIADGIALLAPRLGRRTPAGGPGTHRRDSPLRSVLIFAVAALAVLAALTMSFKPLSATGRMIFVIKGKGTE